MAHWPHKQRTNDWFDDVMGCAQEDQEGAKKEEGSRAAARSWAKRSGGKGGGSGITYLGAASHMGCAKGETLKRRWIDSSALLDPSVNIVEEERGEGDGEDEGEMGKRKRGPQLRRTRPP